MTWKIILPAAAVALSACATIVDERSTDAVIQNGFNAGERYTIRERTLDGPQGTYKQTSVVYRGISSTCRIDSRTTANAWRKRWLTTIHSAASTTTSKQLLD